MSNLNLFSVGEQWDWDRFIDLQMGYNYFEYVAKECFKTDYQKVNNYSDIKDLYRHEPSSDIAIRFDNCFAKPNLETMLNSNIQSIIEKTILRGFNVLLYVPTESFTKQDLRSCSRYFRHEIREKLHYANCNPYIFDYNDYGINLHFVDYFSMWSVTGNIHWTSQVNYSKPKKDFLAMALRMAPGKRIMLDAIKQVKLYDKGYITDETGTIDNLDTSEGRYKIRSMQDEYEKHPNFMNIKPWINAISYEVVIEDTEDISPLYTSEKIYRTIFNKIPFMVYGKKGYLKLLKRLGYKTFDKIFDESYDNIDIREERAKFIANEMKRFNNLPDEEKQKLVDDAKPIIEHNYNLLTNPEKIGLVYSKPINSQ
tara:strand:- start:498 stop:1601 length:1104 start_codon:yes stop_codon:yes gene_type:complete